MTLKHTFTAITLVTLMVVLGATPALSVYAQPSSSVTVSLPVNGSLALPVGLRPNEKLYVINTSTGAVQTLAEAPGSNNFPVWDSQGTKLAYYRIRTDSIFSDLSTNTTHTIETFSGFNPDNLSFPMGWSQDGTNLLYLYVDVQLLSSNYTLNLLDLASGSLSEILHLITDNPLTNIPLPLGHNNLKLTGIPKVKRNPIHDNWVLLQLKTEDLVPTLTLDEGVLSFYVDILWNYTTGQMISLDNLVNEPITSSDFDWSPDGRYLLLTTTDSRRNDTTHILQFQSDGTIQVVDSAPTSRQTEFWLGAGNLMLARSLDNVTNEFVYYIGEIFDGTWHETAFIRLHGDEFRAMRPGDWYIRASEQEKQRLSCTFDQSLTTQLQIGVQGRVTSGVSSRLRVEPTTYSAEVSQLSAGTTFSVIGGTWCANGYRWWNIQLADGTSGWIAEADAISYFIEPIPVTTATAA